MKTGGEPPCIKKGDGKEGKGEQTPSSQQTKQQKQKKEGGWGAEQEGDRKEAPIKAGRPKIKRGEGAGCRNQRHGRGQQGPENSDSKEHQKKHEGATQAWTGHNEARGQNAKGKVRRAKTRLGGRPARPGQEGRAHAHTLGTRACRPLTRKGSFWLPHETAPVHQPSPPLRPDASVTRSTHANHRSASSPRPTPEGPARENQIAGPQTGETRSGPSAPASAGASGGHKEPGSRPASACPAQPPNKSGIESPRYQKRHHGVGKADRSTKSDSTEQGAAHHAGPRATPERHAAGHNHETRTAARKQQPPGAANTDNAHHNHTTTAEEQQRRGDEAKQRQRHRTPRTGSSGADQAAGASAPRRGASRDQWQWTPRTG